MRRSLELIEFYNQRSRAYGYNRNNTINYSIPGHLDRIDMFDAPEKRFREKMHVSVLVSYVYHIGTATNVSYNQYLSDEW